MIEKLVNFLTSYNFIASVIVIILGIIFNVILGNIFSKVMEKKKGINHKKNTYLRLIRNIIKYVLIVIVIVIVLQINGINVTSIIAGVGVISVITGLALQDALKDIIMGLNIIFDDYFSVGDIVTIDNITGKIMEIGLKTTKIKDIANDNVLVIANRNIGKALTISNVIDIEMALPYEKSIEEIDKVISIIVSEIEKIENVINVTYLGLTKFADSAIIYKIRMKADPLNKAKVKLASNRIIKTILDKNNIEIPYNQLDVHKK